jgi:hypothetical protein
METLLASRIELTPRPSQNRAPVLVCGMVGHCPGRVRQERLFELTGAVEAIRSAGFRDQLERLKSADEAIFHLPIPLSSSAEFHDIFPDAATASTGYRSTLAGATAWLPRCVNDFFTNGGSRLWVVIVPEDEHQQAFYPSPDTVLHDPATLRGFTSLLVIPEIGLITMPDLERLQIPPELTGLPDQNPDPITPTFMPCSRDIPEQDPMPVPSTHGLPTPWPCEHLLAETLPWLSRARPDIQCLWPAPLDYDEQHRMPAASRQALHTIGMLAAKQGGHRLRQIQFVFPYLTDEHGRPTSPCGVLAGAQSAMAGAKGPWHSIAGQPLSTTGDPFPPQSIPAIKALRETPGISVLSRKPRGIMLDDERLVVPALPPEDYDRARQQERFDAFRSAELMRFLGYLRRQLQLLGENLVFKADPGDPTPRLVLENFLRQLHRQGALRGSLPEDAFTIIPLRAGEGALVFEVMLAPALPIDQIRLTFTNRHGEWQGAVHDE